MEMAYMIHHNELKQGIPKTHWEAYKGPDRDIWHAAEKREIALLDKYEAYELVDLPADYQPIRTKMVYEIKKGLPCARFCAKGFEQRPGIDYEGTWAPVVSVQSMRMFFALAASYDLDIQQMDVSRAFLNSPIDKEIYVLPPIHHGYGNKVFKLKKAIPGLKQSGMLWHKEIDKTLTETGLAGLKADPCVYTNTRPLDDPDFIAILLTVDDLMIISQSQEAIASMKQYLMQSYVMKDMGAVTKCCGFEIVRDKEKRSIRMSQGSYTMDILEWAAHITKWQLKEETSPIIPHLKLSPSTEMAEEEDIKQYQKAIGYLHYLVMGTRPDIAFATSILSAFVNNPDATHWRALGRIYGYIMATKYKFIEYKRGDWKPIGYSDANHGGDVTDNMMIPPRSFGSFMFMSASGAIGWSTKRQIRTAITSFDSEAIALLKATSEAKYLHQYYSE